MEYVVGFLPIVVGFGLLMVLNKKFKTLNKQQRLLFCNKIMKVCIIIAIPSVFGIFYCVNKLFKSDFGSGSMEMFFVVFIGSISLFACSFGGFFGMVISKKLISKAEALKIE